jgi:hypothetical protein
VNRGDAVGSQSLRLAAARVDASSVLVMNGIALQLPTRVSAAAPNFLSGP